LNIIEAALLGIIQGITEFLPISSTGHLTVAGQLMHLISADHPEKWTSFIAVIQLGTLAAVLIYFWNDIWNIVSEFAVDNLKERKRFVNQSNNSKLGWLIIFGTIPVVIIGILFKNQIEGSITKNLYVIAWSLIGLAIILAIAEKIAKFRKNIKDLTILDSIIIGIAQVFALIPGSSRSGTTITGGLFVGLNREAAARFSFLLSIPAVFASGLFELYESLKYLDSSIILNLIISTIAAGITGYFAIDFLLKYLRKNTTFLFVYYRVIIGVVIILLLYSNVIQP